MIRPERRHRGYIPIYEDRAGNALGIDLDPGPEGIVGQVINFGPDETFKHVLALSWGQFLEDVADELEAGHAFVTPPDECDERTPRFGLRGSPEGWLFHILPEWSRAKLPGR
jgi:cell wall assembly regulator SMI1